MDGALETEEDKRVKCDLFMNYHDGIMLYRLNRKEKEIGWMRLREREKREDEEGKVNV